MYTCSHTHTHTHIYTIHVQYIYIYIYIYIFQERNKTIKHDKNSQLKVSRSRYSNELVLNKSCDSVLRFHALSNVKILRIKKAYNGI